MNSLASDMGIPEDLDRVIRPHETIVRRARMMASSTTGKMCYILSEGDLAAAGRLKGVSRRQSGVNLNHG